MKAHRSSAPPKTSRLILTAALGAAAVAIFVLEKRRPLRTPTQPEPRRTLRNLALGALSMAVVSALENPVVEPLASRASARKRGLVHKLAVSPPVQDLLAMLAMDYTIFLWHVAMHRMPFLWRFHLVHHVDLDLDSTTALRFHFAEMALSIPYRALQVLAIGTSRRALAAWQALFFLSVLFHHSNLRLPRRLERVLALLVITPRLHGIHHSAVKEETNSNWSSGLTVWDRLHGTLRIDVPQPGIRIGVAAYRRSRETGFWSSLSLPFRRHRDAWTGELHPPLVRSLERQQ